MKAAQLDVLHNTVEDLKNELAGFKKTMAGVCHKYDNNFRRNVAACRHLHEGWVTHEAAIEKINERCTCGTYVLEPPQRRGPAARGFVEMPRILPKRQRGNNKG